MVEDANSSFDRSLQVAEDALGLPATKYAGAAVALSEDALAKTLIGAYLLRLYYANEDQARARLAGLKIRAEDRQAVDALYQKHAQEIDDIVASVVRHEGIPVSNIDYEAYLDSEQLKRIVSAYIEADGRAAMDELAPLASMFVGASHSKILELLNDKQVYDLVRKALSGVHSLTQPG